MHISILDDKYFNTQSFFILLQNKKVNFLEITNKQWLIIDQFKYY